MISLYTLSIVKIKVFYTFETIILLKRLTLTIIIYKLIYINNCDFCQYETFYTNNISFNFKYKNIIRN